MQITAWSDDETIMAVQHKAHSHIQGVQFHPESIITDGGLQVAHLKNLFTTHLFPSNKYMEA